MNSILSCRKLLPLASALLLCAVPTKAEGIEDEGYNNSVYLHPVSLAGSIVSNLTDTKYMGLQMDYERAAIPHMSAITTLSYMGFELEHSGYEVKLHNFDFMLGARWYPMSRFDGLYLQPTLDLNMMWGTASDSTKKGDIDIARVGPMLYLGYNRRFGHFSLDWNVGIGYLGWDDAYTEVERKHDKSGKAYDTTYTVALTKKAGNNAGFLMGTPQFGANLSLGWAF